MNEAVLTKITPNRFSGVGLGELWRYRELIYFLAWRDVKIRYKQTAIGIAWAILQPVVTTLIFSVIFSRYANFDTGQVPYAAFALAGLTLWLFVHGSVTMASGSFTGNSNLVTKVWFPRLIVPIAAVIAGLFDLVFSFVVLGAMLGWYATGWHLSMVLVPLFVLMGFVTAASLGILFAALNVRFRDVRFALPFLLQVWMIASPIFYPSSILGERTRFVFAVNPLVGAIEGLRSAVFGLPFDWAVIGISTLSAAILLAVSLAVFVHLEDDLADMI